MACHLFYDPPCCLRYSYYCSGGYVRKKTNHTISIKGLILSTIVVGTIIVGYFYPLAGFVVPVVMLVGMVVGAIRGRYTCGNICPRGAFFDSFLPFKSRNRKIPAFITSGWFRWSAFLLLMSFTTFRVLQNPTSTMHLGSVFWTLCAVTTPIGIIGGLLYKPRFWCSFCPMGTLQNVLGGRRNRLQIDGAVCKSCKLCEKACPLNLDIVKYKETGESSERDCLKCRKCTLVCPKKALEVPSFGSRATKALMKVYPALGRFSDKQRSFPDSKKAA